MRRGWCESERDPQRINRVCNGLLWPASVQIWWDHLDPLLHAELETNELLCQDQAERYCGLAHAMLARHQGKGAYDGVFGERQACVYATKVHDNQACSRIALRSRLNWRFWKPLLLCLDQVLRSGPYRHRNSICCLRHLGGLCLEHRDGPTYALPRYLRRAPRDWRTDVQPLPLFEACEYGQSYRVRHYCSSRRDQRSWVSMTREDNFVWPDF